MPTVNLLSLLFLVVKFYLCFSSSDKTPHGHKGLLTPFDGRQIPYTITKSQSDLLNLGKPVVYSDKLSGKGLVIQDINAPTSICMEKIIDLKNYNKYVAQVKKVQIYRNLKLPNGTSLYAARFDVSALAMGFTYWLSLKHEPKYNTFTWTLDYDYNSDFDDNIGHWQVMEHPTKRGWTRVLYSCQLKLYSWIPNFIVNYLVKTALVESTTWVTKESEKAVKNLSPNERSLLSNTNTNKDLNFCYVDQGNTYRYYIQSKGLKCQKGSSTEPTVNTLNRSSKIITPDTIDKSYALFFSLLALTIALSPHTPLLLSIYKYFLFLSFIILLIFLLP